MTRRTTINRLLWTALLALTRGAATSLGASLIGLITWWITHH